jgi:hypothetical protein
MAQEEVLNLPLETEEIIEIVLQRIKARMQANCHFSSAVTYNAFSADVTINFRLNDMNFGKTTLVWDKIELGEKVPAEAPVETVSEKIESGDSPNAARQDADLPVPVLVTEGRKRVIKKIRIPKKGKAA